MSFKFRPFPTIPDVILIEPTVFEDDRGSFAETYKASEFRTNGLAAAFVQDNESFSLKKGTLRGFHYQNPPAAQGKLVRVTSGKVLDVVVDIRKGSPTYAKHVQAELTESNREMLWIPPGFAHAVLTLVDDTSITYKVTAEYSKEHERAIRWDDPEIRAPWPTRSPLLSAKDRDAPFLKDAENGFG